MSLEDEFGLVDVTVFEDVYQRYGDCISLLRPARWWWRGPSETGQPGDHHRQKGKTPAIIGRGLLPSIVMVRLVSAG